jgi:hypothetical protein
VITCSAKPRLRWSVASLPPRRRRSRGPLPTPVSTARSPQWSLTIRSNILTGASAAGPSGLPVEPPTNDKPEQHADQQHRARHSQKVSLQHLREPTMTKSLSRRPTRLARSTAGLSPQPSTAARRQRATPPVAPPPSFHSTRAQQSVLALVGIRGDAPRRWVAGRKRFGDGGWGTR